MTALLRLRLGEGLALRVRSALIVGAAAALLTACGQKGPLVLPDGMSGNSGPTAPAAGGAASEDGDEQAADGERTEDRSDGR